MGAVLPFVIRTSDDVDWSAAERARLEQLADTLTADSGVHLAYGRSDTGEPWCVVLDDNDDVLVHVARIDGSFIVHSVAEEVVEHASELSAALDRYLAYRSDDRQDVVVPFVGRAAHLFAAIVVTATFTLHERARAGELAGWSGDLASDDDRRDIIERAMLAPSRAAADVGSLALAFPTGLSSVTEHHLPSDAHAGSVDGRAVIAEMVARVIEAPAPAEAVSHADALPDMFVPVAAEPPSASPEPTGSPTADSPAALFRLVHGTDEPDSIAVTSSTVATGGAGSDQFVVHTPTTDGANALMGIITDYTPAEGDRISFTAPGNATVVSTVGVADILFGTPAREAMPLPGVQVNYDFNGDGRADGFLLLNAAPPPDHSDSPAPVLPQVFEPASITPAHVMIEPPVHAATIDGAVLAVV